MNNFISIKFSRKPMSFSDNTKKEKCKKYRTQKLIVRIKRKTLKKKQQK